MHKNQWTEKENVIKYVYYISTKNHIMLFVVSLMELKIIILTKKSQEHGMRVCVRINNYIYEHYESGGLLVETCPLPKVTVGGQ